MILRKFCFIFALIFSILLSFSSSVFATPFYTYTGSSTLVDVGGGKFSIQLLTSGTFTPLINMTADVLLVGGGGSGGFSETNAGGSGGGGGGGVVYATSVSLTQTAYGVVIGGGGGATTVAGQHGISGGNTMFNGLTALGGGGGGNGSGTGSGSSGYSGGCGGGAAYNGNTGASAGTGSQGGSGALNSGAQGGGGGGAGGAGGVSAGGLPYYSSITGTSIAYAGGGAGGNNGNHGASSATIGGGGGGNYGNVANPSSAGATGIVVIRFTDSVAPTHGAFQDANPRYANIAYGGTFRVHTAGATDTGGSGVEGTYLWVATDLTADGGWANSWNILGAQKMNYWYDAGSSWYDVPVTTEGKYIIHSNVLDNAGNWAWGGPSEVVYIDRTIPIIGAITGYRVLNTNSGTNEYVSVSNVSDSGSSGLASLQYAYFVPGASDWVYSGWLTNTASSYAVSIPITVEGTYNVAIRVQDNAGNISNVGGDEWKRTSFLIDRTAPSGGSISYSATTITSSTQSLSITVADGTDSSAGINTSSRQLLRQEAIYNNGTCGSYGNPYPVSYSGTYPNITTSNFDLNRCYKYFWRIADNANNNTFYSSSNVVTATKPNLALKDVSLGTVISINNLSFVKVTTTGLLVALEEHPFVTTTTFSYTGAAQTFTVPRSGWYQIETWGASGGNSVGTTSGTTMYGGLGTYTKGNIYLGKGETIYLYVGQSGLNINQTITFNGGGIGGPNYNAKSGGGATDIRLSPGLWNDSNGLKSRIMVAAGGGGADGYANGSYGGTGGTLVGGNGNVYNQSTYPYTVALGGTQILGGAGAVGAYSGYAGVFGIGGNNNQSHGGGGGSGYYGGGGGCYNDSVVGSGAGGSSFISGYAGANAITSSSSTAATNNTLHYSGKYFLDGQMQAGVRSDNGEAKITYLGNSLAKVNNNLNNVRYIKDCVNGSTANAGNHWVELQAIKNGINVAKNKIVTANHWVAPWGTGSLNTITDGDITTSQYSDGGSDGLTCITVDLGQAYDLDEIAVWHYYGDPRTYNNNVTYVSTNNSTWTTVISITEPETANGKRVSAY